MSFRSIAAKWTLTGLLRLFGPLAHQKNIHQEQFPKKVTNSKLQTALFLLQQAKCARWSFQKTHLDREEQHERVVERRNFRQQASLYLHRAYRNLRCRTQFVAQNWGLPPDFKNACTGDTKPRDAYRSDIFFFPCLCTLRRTPHQCNKRPNTLSANCTLTPKFFMIRRSSALQLRLSFSMPNTCQVDSEIAAPAPGLASKWFLNPLFGELARPNFSFPSSFFIDWYCPVKRKIHSIKRHEPIKD